MVTLAQRCLARQDDQLRAEVGLRIMIEVCRICNEDLRSLSLLDQIHIGQCRKRVD